MIKWRQGFFRIWVVLAVSWTILVIAFSYRGIVDPQIDRRGFVYSAVDLGGDQHVSLPTEIVHTKRLYSVSSYSEVYDELRRQKVEGRMREIKLASIPEFSLFLSSDLDVAAMSAQMDEANKWAGETKGRLISENRWVAFSALLPTVLLPPFALLAFGIILNWVAAGFRRQA
jgi:hypothetical protein